MFKININKQTIAIRFLATLFVNIARMGLSFISGIFIARGLGPAEYGNYSFLLGSFVSVTTLVDMGTSSAFYTFLSQRKRSSIFYLYYILWIGIQFAVILLFIGCIFPQVFMDKIWLGHTRRIILLAFVASFMMDKVWQVVARAGESIRATVVVQLYNIAIAGLYLFVIFILVFLCRLTVTNLFITATFIYLLFTLILAKRLKTSLVGSEETSLTGVIREFRVYCAPLVIYSIVGFVYSFADVWLLQRFGGPIQQGFYSVGMRLSAICLIATSSILQVFWKETAEANNLGDKKRLFYLYTRISRGVFFVSACIGCFFIPFSKEVLTFFLGQKYMTAWPSLAIMLLYPMHQSLGQANATFFYATGETNLYSRIGIIMMLISIPLTYFVLAGSSAFLPGLNLGSVGLALKAVILQIITVNIFTYFICKFSVKKFGFIYQFVDIGVLFFASFLIKLFLNWFFSILNISLSPLALMASCFLPYVLVAGLFAYIVPVFSGIEKKNI